jgi:hypothetical protein
MSKNTHLFFCVFGLNSSLVLYTYILYDLDEMYMSINTYLWPVLYDGGLVHMYYYWLVGINT